MKESNTAERLKIIMAERDLKQIDILKMTFPYCKKYGVKMNKSDISQYCSGKVEPNQNKLFVLGAALNVDEAWLMGYDVPMERIKYEEQYAGRLNEEQQHLNFFEKRLLKSFLKLTDENKKRSINYTENLLILQNMDTEQATLLNAAHDNGATKEQKNNADNIMMDDSEWE